MVRQVLSAETSRQVNAILEQVVCDTTHGTGKNAYVAGYRVAGKTGTSEKVAQDAAGAGRNTSSPSSATPPRTTRRWSA